MSVSTPHAAPLQTNKALRNPMHAVPPTSALLRTWPRNRWLLRRRLWCCGGCHWLGCLLHYRAHLHTPQRMALGQCGGLQVLQPQALAIHHRPACLLPTALHSPGCRTSFSTSGDGWLARLSRTIESLNCSAAGLRPSTNQGCVKMPCNTDKTASQAWVRRLASGSSPQVDAGRRHGRQLGYRQAQAALQPSYGRLLRPALRLPRRGQHQSAACHHAPTCNVGRASRSCTRMRLIRSRTPSLRHRSRGAEKQQSALAVECHMAEGSSSMQACDTTWHA